MSDEFDVDDILIERAADIENADMSTWLRVDASMSREEVIAKLLNIDIALLTPDMTDAEIVEVLKQSKKPYH